MGHKWDIGAFSAGKICCKSFQCVDIRPVKTSETMRHAMTELMAVESGQD